ncbi:MAG: hypothetical protein ABII72_02820 [Parcubacteria group bacterium]
MSKKSFYLLICLFLLVPIFLLVAKPLTKSISLQKILQTVSVIKAEPSFACKFNKAAYEGEPGEKIELVSARLVGAGGEEIDVLEELRPRTTEKKGGLK